LNNKINHFQLLFKRVSSDPIMKSNYQAILVVLTAILALYVCVVQGSELSTTVEIGPDGGTLKIPGYVVAIIPPGALTKTTQLKIRQVAKPTGQPPTMFATEMLPPVFEFTPVVEFAKLVEIRLYCGERCPPQDQFDRGMALGQVNAQGQVQIELGLYRNANNYETPPHYPNYKEGYIAVWLDQWAGTRMFLSYNGVTQRVGPAGGTLDLPDRIRAVIPPNALSEMVELRIRQVAVPTNLVNAAGDVIGPLYEFTPALQLLKPVIIYLWYSPGWMPKWIHPGERRPHLSALNIVEIDTETDQPSKLFGEQTNSYTFSPSAEYYYVGMRIDRWKGRRSLYLPATRMGPEKQRQLK
jgi:hypothetical protein